MATRIFRNTSNKKITLLPTGDEVEPSETISYSGEFLAPQHPDLEEITDEESEGKDEPKK